MDIAKCLVKNQVVYRSSMVDVNYIYQAVAICGRPNKIQPLSIICNSEIYSEHTEIIHTVTQKCNLQKVACQ